MTSGFGRTLAAAALAMLILPAGASSAQQTPGPAIGVEIGPSRVERDLPDRSISLQYVIVNHEAAPRRIAMSISGLGHDLDGTPEFLEPARATDVLHLSESAFTLAPSERKVVQVTGAIPDGDRSLYAAVIAEFAPLQPQTGTVETRSRVAGLLLLRGPRPWQESVSLEDVGFLPGPKQGTVTVAAALKNTGNVHVRPSGLARITQGGKLLATVPLQQQLIIPGFARRISGVWTPPSGLTGSLTIGVATQNPAASGSGTGSLSKGVVDRPQGKIVNLRAYDQSGALITLTIVNTGRAPLTSAVVLFVTESGAERARTILTEAAIPPGKSADAEWRPGLDDGTYVITAQLRSGDLLLDQGVTGLRLGGAPPPARVGRTKKPALVATAAALQALCLVGLLYTWLRRRGRNARPPTRGRTAVA